MRKVWSRRWTDALAGVPVALLMLVTPAGSFLSPRGRNRAVMTLMTIGLAVEATYVVKQVFRDLEQARRGEA